MAPKAVDLIGIDNNFFPGGALAWSRGDRIAPAAKTASARSSRTTRSRDGWRISPASSN